MKTVGVKFLASFNKKTTEKDFVKNKKMAVIVYIFEEKFYKNKFIFYNK